MNNDVGTSNTNTGPRAVNAVLKIKLMTMMATVGLERWQICFGDSEHLARIELTGGERRGCDSDDSTELMDTFA